MTAETATPRARDAQAHEARTWTLPVSAVERRLTRIRVGTLATAAFVLATAVRLIGLGRSEDIFGDEIYYVDIGRSTVNGGFPRYLGSTFFLHPPGFFYLEGAWSRLLGIDGLTGPNDTVSLVYEMRALNAVFAGVTAAVLVLLIVRACGSRVAALAAVLAFSLDPFVLRLNQRVLIETATMMWVLLGYLVLLPLARPREDGTLPHGGRARVRAAIAGLLMGFAVLTKDEAALLTVLPLIAAFVLGWGAKRGLTAVAGFASVVPYGAYLVVVALNHQLDRWVAVKTYGIKRLAGYLQDTGFNKAGAPSLTHRIVAQAGQFGLTYVILAVGTLALVTLVRRGDRAMRMLVLLHVSAFLTLGYALGIGTLEEQALYLLFLPNLVTLAVVLPLWLGNTERGITGDVTVKRVRVQQIAQVATAVLLVFGMGYYATTYVSDRVHPDDGYARLDAYMREHVPAGSSVTSASGPASLVLQSRYDMGTWSTPQELSAQHVGYVVVSWKLVDQGYSSFTTDQLQSLVSRGHLVFAFDGRTYGWTEVYQLPGAPKAPTDTTTASPVVSP